LVYFVHTPTVTESCLCYLCRVFVRLHRRKGEKSREFRKWFRRNDGGEEWGGRLKKSDALAVLGEALNALPGRMIGKALSKCGRLRTTQPQVHATQPQIHVCTHRYRYRQSFPGRCATGSGVTMGKNLLSECVTSCITVALQYCNLKYRTIFRYCRYRYRYWSEDVIPGAGGEALVLRILSVSLLIGEEHCGLCDYMQPGI
jgi:hypothetical protein